MGQLITSLHGGLVGIGDDGSLVNKEGLQISPRCVDASIVVGAEAANVRDITIQLKDAFGKDLKEVTVIKAHVFLNAAATAFVVTGGSTGIEADTDGALLAVVAKKSFVLTSEADGDISLTWTDTGTEAAFLGLELPNGELIISDALTNA